MPTDSAALEAETIDLTDPALHARKQPVEELGALRDKHGIFWNALPSGNPYGHPGFWSILKHRDVREISLHPELFSSEKKGNTLWDHPASLDGALIAIDPPKHMRLRSFVNPNFAPNRIAALESWITDLINSLLDPAIEGGRTEFVYDVAARIPTRTFCHMMDVHGEESQKLIDWIDEFSAESASPSPRMIAVLGAIAEYGNLLAETRRDKTGNDVVSAMMTAEYDGKPLTEVEFGNMFMTIATGASETMRSLFSHTMLSLARDPALYEDLRRNPDIIPTAVDEFIRVSTPLNFFRRTVTQDTVFGGHEMKEGDAVVIWYLSANFDPDVFEAPDRIDLRRKPNQQLSFGIGEHFCLGARVARLQAAVFLRELTRRVKSIELDGEVTRIGQPMANLYGQLPLRLTAA